MSVRQDHWVNLEILYLLGGFHGMEWLFRTEGIDDDGSDGNGPGGTPTGGSKEDNDDDNGGTGGGAPIGAPTGGTPLVQSCVLIGCGAHIHSWQIGFYHCQLKAILRDPDYKGGNYDTDAGDPGPVNGLSLARQVFWAGGLAGNGARFHRVVLNGYSQC